MTPAQRSLDAVRAIAASRVHPTASLATRICEVPAPTGDEGRRADLVDRLLRERGYASERDDAGNVYARRGERGGPVLMLAAHTDTVFPVGTDTSVRVEGTTLHGPGIGDNSLGVAAAIAAFDILDELQATTDVDVVLAATTGEEGLGNLRGVRAAVERYRDELGALIAVEGHNLGRVTHAAVGSVRWRITTSGPGGHSWGAFGKPSAIHRLARIIAAIDDLSVPGDPKTTYNVGMIDGGVSVNTIAPRASALVDMRSVDARELQRLAERVGQLARDADGNGVSVEIEVLGERPAGQTPRAHWLVGTAGDILRRLGMQPIFDASSTDANVPMSLGIPAICIGMTHGANGHTTNELIELPPLATGLSQLATLILAATEALAGARRG